VKRPIELSPQIQPIIPTPTHGSLPSGHATEAFTLARLIWKLLLASKVKRYAEGAYWGTMLMRTAARIAENRTVAGVHYPVDSEAGAFLGLNIAEFIAQQCGATKGNWTSGEFTGGRFDAEADFDWNGLYRPQRDHLHDRSKLPAWIKVEHHGKAKASSAPLKWLWEKAVSEWEDLPADSGV
ncbi:MAG: phosphatase PAP2 family protein, partial [Pseudomonadota bacterium]